MENLIKTNQISEPKNLTVPKISSTDLAPLFQSFFNKEAKQSLSIKAHSLVHQWNQLHGDPKLQYKDFLVEFMAKLKIKATEEYRPQAMYVRKIAQVQCFGLLTNENRIAEAALRLVDVINHMSKFNYIKASLTDLMLIPLGDYNNPGTTRYAIVSYLAIDSDYEMIVKANYGQYMFQEGGIPPEFK